MSYPQDHYLWWDALSSALPLFGMAVATASPVVVHV